MAEGGKGGGKRGLPNAFLAGVKPTTDGYTGMKIRVTTEVMQSIFAEFPAVKRAYHENVPGRLSEKEFWTGYFQSQFFHRQRSAQLSGTPTEQLAGQMFAKAALEEEAKDAEASQPHAKRAASLSLSCDVTPETEDDVAVRLRQVAPPDPVVRRFNRHSAVVLGVADPRLGTAAGGAQEEGPPMRDLAGEPERPVVPLSCGPDSSAYFRRGVAAQQQPKVASSPNLTVSQLICEVDNEAKAKRDARKDSKCLAGASGAGGSKALQDMSAELAKSAAREKEKPGVSEATPEVIKARYQRAAELARHLWACYPLASKAAEMKAGQVAAAIQSERGRLNPRDPGMQACLKLLDVALERFTQTPTGDRTQLR